MTETSTATPLRSLLSPLRTHRESPNEPQIRMHRRGAHHAPICGVGGLSMMKSDYSADYASGETLEAMRDRCQEQGHQWENCCSFTFRVYMRCKWCGEED